MKLFKFLALLFMGANCLDAMDTPLSPDSQLSATQLITISQPTELRTPKTFRLDSYIHKFSCPECNKQIIGGPSALIKHILAKHTNLKPFRCPDPECLHETVGQFQLNTHMRKVHNSDKPVELSLQDQKNASAILNPFLEKLGWTHACQKCDRLFPSFPSLKTHSRCHPLNFSTHNNRNHQSHSQDPQEDDFLAGILNE